MKIKAQITILKIREILLTQQNLTIFSHHHCV